MAKNREPKKKNAVAPDLEWDMLPNESPLMYERFCWYRDVIYYDDAELQNTHVLDITKRRSYRACADHFGLALNTVEREGKKYRWQERCEAYDRYIALLARRENERKVKKMLNNHALLGAAMVQRAAARFISLKENEIDAADTIRMADVGVKIERMSRGVSSEDTVVYLNPNPEDARERPAATVDVNPVFDFDSLTDEELNQLERIVGKFTAAHGE